MTILLLGAYAEDPNDHGAVYVYSGKDQSQLYRFEGQEVGGRFGYSIAGGIDLSGDGIPDFAIGEPREFINPLSGEKTGRVQVISGANGDTLVELTGDVESSKDQLFGYSIVLIDDVNGDGFGEIAVGSPSYKVKANNPESNAGLVEIFFGDTAITWERAIFYDGGIKDRAGIALAYMSDLNSDGFPDLVIGGPGTSSQNKGVVSIFSVGQTDCFNTEWSADDGMLPSNSCPEWALTDNATSSPVFLGDTLVITTANPFESQYFEITAPQIAFPDTIVVEFEVKAISGQGGQAHAQMAVTLAPDSGVVISLDSLGNLHGTGDGELGIGAFHKIQLRVFPDGLYNLFGDGRLLIAGFAISDPSLPDVPGIRFGEWDDDIRSQSYWRNIRHNAYAFDTDLDGDGIPDSCDNCISIINPLQVNSDGDILGDLCDNCPTVDNLTQEDVDLDGFGDACDNCPNNFNQTQIDTDGDNVGDVCDECPGFDDFADIDADGVPDSCDNCPNNFNPLQEDIDGDGLGDSCYLPNYLAPLIIVVREVIDTFPNSRALSLPGGDPGVNLCIEDPDGFLICADSASHNDTSTIINTIGTGAHYFNITGEDSVVIDSPKTGTYLIEVIREFDDDPTKKYLAEIRVDGTVDHITGVMTVPSDDDTDTLFHESEPYIQGDADGSGEVTIGDATFLVKYIFQDGETPPELGAADADCSGYQNFPDVNIGDAIFIVKYIFQDGPAPGCPPGT